MIPFEGEWYFDDRMFIVHVCRCVVDDTKAESISTSIIHDSPPADARWGVLTLRNTLRFPAVRVDTFASRDEADAFLRRVEPVTPLISLGGQGPKTPMSFDEYSDWKRRLALKDYNPDNVFSPGGGSRKEVLIQPRQRRD